MLKTKAFFVLLIIFVFNFQGIPLFLGDSSARAEEKGSNMREKMKKIRITVKGREAVVILNDNSASKSFMTMLPLDLTFEEYNGTEKISYLPKKLDTNDAPMSCEPKSGSFTYYAPWGNLAVFYRGFPRSNGLVPLGEFESGLDILTGQKNNFSARIERIE